MGFQWRVSVMSYRVRLEMTSFEVLRVKSVPIIMSHSLGMDVMMMVRKVRSSIFPPWALTFAHTSCIQEK